MKPNRSRAPRRTADAASIAAVMTLRARFAQGDAGAVVAVFNAMIRALTGGERRH
jgi:hypothetical protein